MPNPEIRPAPPGLGGPPMAPVAAQPPTPGAPEDAPAGAERPVQHDMASRDGSAMSDNADVATQLEDLENRFQALDHTVQELTGLVMDLQASVANLLENNLRRRASPPP